MDVSFERWCMCMVIGACFYRRSYPACQTSRGHGTVLSSLELRLVISYISRSRGPPERHPAVPQAQSAARLAIDDGLASHVLAVRVAVLGILRTVLIPESDLQPRPRHVGIDATYPHAVLLNRGALLARCCGRGDGLDSHGQQHISNVLGHCL